MIPFTELPDLAAERLSGQVLWANDEFFAPKENLLREAPAVFDSGRYTERGKWMDGWETRRRRVPGNDACVVRLGRPGIVHGVTVDTAHFTGNFPEAASVQALELDRDPTAAEMEAPGAPWIGILPPAPLRGDAANVFAVADRRRFTHVRLTIHPDGGIARLRVHGEVAPDRARLARSGGLVDLAAIENGGLVLKTSDSHFGGHHHLLMPGRPAGMHDGWETRRQRRGCDWALLRLGVRGTLGRIEVDTGWFKGNFPDRCSLEVVDLADASLDALMNPWLRWTELLHPVKLGPDTVHVFEKELRDPRPATHARFRIYPDGGVARLRLFGEPAP